MMNNYMKKEGDLLSASSGNPLSSNHREDMSNKIRLKPPRMHSQKRTNMNLDSDMKRGVSPIIEEENSI
jgi:hypothetical protein